MPDEVHVRWPRWATGAILIGSGVAAAILLAWLTSGSGVGLAPRKLTVTTYFINSEGLKPGAAVNLDGVNVGTVKSVSITQAAERAKTPVQVMMRLKPRYQASLHEDSLAELVNLGALADTVVEIDSKQATGPPLHDGDELKTGNTPSVLDLKAGQATMNAANALVDRLNPLVDQAVSGKGTIGQLISNPGLVNNAKQTVDKVHRISAKLGGDTSSAGKLVNDHDLADKFASIGKNMQGINASLARLEGGPLEANLTATQTQANALMADVKAGNGSVGMLMKDPSALKNTAALAGKLMADIRAGKGTAGKLVADDEFRENLGQLQKQSSEFAAAVRKNPKKYLSIDFRVF